MECVECGTVRVFPPRCGLRWCPLCMPAHGARQLARLLGMVKHCGMSKTLTLSVESDHSLPLAFKRLMDAWGKFSASKEYRAHYSASVVVIEFTWGVEFGWHPHLHVMAAGTFWQQEAMAGKWVQCAKGRANSASQWVQEIKSHERLARYLCKYLTKGVEKLAETLPMLQLAQLIEFTWGRRLLRSYGEAYGLVVFDEASMGCESCGSELQVVLGLRARLILMGPSDPPIELELANPWTGAPVPGYRLPST